MPDLTEMPAWVHAVDFGYVFAKALVDVKCLSSKPPQHALPHVGNSRAHVRDIFNVAYGTSLELNRLTIDPVGFNFVARTSQNNGVVARVGLPRGIDPIPGDCLSVAVSGSVLETFVQKEPFVTGFHIMILRPKNHMCTEELMFYAASIRANQWRYSYGRQANRTLKKLLIPAGASIPHWVYGTFSRIVNQLLESAKD